MTQKIINGDPNMGAYEKTVRAELETYWRCNNWGFHPIEQRIGFRKGTADFIVGKNGTLVFVEAKRRKGKVYNLKKQRWENIQNGIQKPAQKRFQEYWEYYGFRYVIAYSWEDFHKVAVELGIEKD